MIDYEARVEMAASFLSALFAGYESGFAEMRAFCKNSRGDVSRRQSFFPVPLGSAVNLAAEMVNLSDRNYDVYIGVLPRSAKRGTADSVQTARWLWADFDSKCMSEELIQEAISSADMVVKSGHGTHAYWQLTTPWALDTYTKREKFTLLLQKVQSRLSGGVADDVSDLPRILRVPGTWNWKRGEKVFVSMERCPEVGPAEVVENQPIGDDEDKRMCGGVTDMVAAAYDDCIPHLFPRWKSSRGHIVNDASVWVRGQLSWYHFMLKHQERVHAQGATTEALRSASIVDGCVEEMTEDFYNLFLELERRGMSPIGYKDNPLYWKEVQNAA